MFIKGIFGCRNLGDDLLYEESISKIPSEYHIYTKAIVLTLKI